MRIQAFKLANFRSIKELSFDRLNDVNVFFGKNNVGKSNILRGLHLAFHLLKDDRIFLPDTAYYNRNIYKPIEIEVDVLFDSEESQRQKIVTQLVDSINDVVISLPGHEDVLSGIGTQVDMFLEMSRSFDPQESFRFSIRCDYDEDVSNVQINIESPDRKDIANYTVYKKLFRGIMRDIKRKLGRVTRRRIKELLENLRALGLEVDRSYTLGIERYGDGIPPKDIEYIVDYLRDSAKNVEGRGEALAMIKKFEMLQPTEELARLEGPFKRLFGLVCSYYNQVADNFLFIPNKEYFRKEPLEEKGGKHVEIFDIGSFQSRLASLIEYPGIRDRQLLKQFNRIFVKTYGDIGEVDIRKFRDLVFAIFDTGFTSLPIENQGLGIQDLYLYLTHMILFDSAVVAIEEPEGGLSVSNQRKLRDIINDVYGEGRKQIFISSHSDEFESHCSYIVEAGANGTNVISRASEKEKYEARIDDILIRRKLAEEKKQLEAVLREVAEREMALDVLKHIEKLADSDPIDPEAIAGELGYDVSQVKEVLDKLQSEK